MILLCQNDAGLMQELIIPLAAVLISLLAIFITIFLNRRSQKKEILEKILEEYRSPKMGSALVELWNFYLRYTSQDAFLDEYISDTKLHGHLENSLHLKRRYVSQFYQMVAIYYFERYISRRKLKNIWSISSLQIIPTILYPIETRAMKAIKGIETGTPSARVDKMIDLYKILTAN